MKTGFVLAALLAGACGINSATAETNAVSWFTVDAGGGFGRGGDYCLEGTIGQADAGELSAGGNYVLAPGFWAGLTVVPTPGSPILHIRLASTGKVVLAWPAAVTGFHLEETSGLASSNNWSATLQPVVDSNGEHTVTVPPAGLFKSYRLKK